MSSWETFNPEDRFAGTSLKKRAEKRTVEQWGERAWRVLGERKLGDAYPEYIVTLPKGSRKYECTCYKHGQGDIRRRKMCSHVLATILYRKDHAEDGTDVEVPDAAGGVEGQSMVPPAVRETEPPLTHFVEIPVSVEPARGDAAARRGHVYRSAAAGTLDADDIPSPHDDMFGDPPMPDKFAEFRPNQWQAIVDIMQHLESGVKVVMLSAPTGSGKTIIGEAVRRLMPGKAVYCCTTKSLQDQIQRDFDYAKTIKGRANYPTLTRPDLTADDCTATSANEYKCDWCPDRTLCPYQVAKGEAVDADLSILNIAYFLAETATRTSSQFGDRELVIIDEADTMEGQLMANIEVVIGAGLRKQLGVYSLPKKTVAKDWARWMQGEILPAVMRRRARLKAEANQLYGKDVKKLRQAKRMDRLARRIKDLLKPSKENPELKVIEDGWVMTGYEGEKDAEATVRFKPIRVNDYAHDALWDRGKQFLLMSATLISPDQMAEDLGLEDDDWAVVHLDSTFPPENRPVFVEAVTAVTNKTKATAYPKIVEAVDEIIEDNPGVRILVHTVSYHLTRHIYDNTTSDRTMTYWNAGEREKTLARFLDVDDAVLLAPSFDRGIDLPEEDCQVIVIAKVPYPYLGDKQVSARLYARGGQSWYAVQTIRSMVQMTGRGMRSRDDWCDSYILDSSFRRLYRDNKRLFPKWWREALVVSRHDPKYRGLVEAARERRDGR